MSFGAGKKLSVRSFLFLNNSLIGWHTTLTTYEIDGVVMRNVG